MTKQLELLRQYCQEQVDNHSIYVWAAEGQMEPTVNEKWIRESEKNTGGNYASIAVGFWKKQHEAGYGPVLKAFDCSGFVSKALDYAEVSTGRMDCDRLWAKCKKISSPKDGCLLFRVNSKNPNDRTHVGFYLDGYQFHAKGRAYGVVKEPFNAHYWSEYGWFRAMPEGEPEPITEPLYFSHNLRNGNKCEDVTKLKRLLISKGYDIGITADNQSYGPSTEKMVRRYQVDNNLGADGIAGKETIQSLGGNYYDG